MNEGPGDGGVNPRLSIVVVNYNTKDHVLELLRSLEEHPSLHEAEAIIVDNASSDDSVEEIGRHFPDAKIVRNETNLGYSKGVNRGIREAKGEFFLVLNPDIRLRDGSLDRLVEYALENPDVGMAGSKLLNPDGSLQYSSRAFYTWRTLLWRRTPIGRLFPDSPVIREHLMLDWDHNSTRDVDWMLGACLLVRRDAVEDVGLMDERFFLYFEDVDWCYRMKAHGWRVVYVADSVMEHRHRRGSARPFSRQKAFHLSSMFHFFEKWSRSLYRWKTRRHFARLGFALLADLAAVNAAFLLAYALRVLLGAIFTKPVFPLSTYGNFLLFVNLTTLLALLGTGFYRESDRPRGAALFVDRFLRGARGATVVYLIVMAATFLTQSRLYSRVLVTIFVALLVAILPVGRLTLHALYGRFRRGAYDLRRAVVIGSNDLARGLADQLRTFPDLGFDLVGFVTEPGDAFIGRGWLGTTDDLPRLVRRHRVTDVFCAGNRDPIELVSRLLLRLADAPVTVRVVSDLSAITVARGEAEEFLNLPMLRFERRILLRYRAGRKRAFDLLLALSAALLTAPLFLFLAATGLVSGARPLLASEMRPHFRGERRRLRTLRVPREGEGGGGGAFLRRVYGRMPALTLIPALGQVAAGKFSFVGPYPEEPERGRFLDEWQRLLVTLRPGLWNVSAVAGYPWVPFRDPVGLNLYYLQCWSAGLDLHIVLRELLRRSGAGGETRP
ncbi:MAG: glycosyltransferase [Candidatus Eisenbacteria bacterium]